MQECVSLIVFGVGGGREWGKSDNTRHPEPDNHRIDPLDAFQSHHILQTQLARYSINRLQLRPKRGANAGCVRTRAYCIRLMEYSACGARGAYNYSALVGQSASRAVRNTGVVVAGIYAAGYAAIPHTHTHTAPFTHKINQQ